MKLRRVRRYDAPCQRNDVGMTKVLTGIRFVVIAICIREPLIAGVMRMMRLMKTQFIDYICHAFHAHEEHRCDGR